jgi:GNAT superfamily N-acetyltransferase
MNITKFDPSTDLTEIKTLLEAKDDVWHRFLNAIVNCNDGPYIAHYNNKITGFLSLNRFNRLRVTPYVYIHEKYRRKGIGTALLRYSDRIISGSCYEHAFCRFTADAGVAEFLAENGYRSFCPEYEMARDTTLLDCVKLSDAALAKKGISIRNYRDEDYLAWHNISDVAFYLLREELGLTPSYYYPPSEAERRKFSNNCADKYVMSADGVIAAICDVQDTGFHLLAVRPDLQLRGYGRLMLSYLNNLMITQRHADKITISVLDGNPSKRLYDSLGFRKVRYVYNYIKYYKPDSRQSAPKGYATKDEILNAFRMNGMLREEMAP